MNTQTLCSRLLELPLNRSRDAVPLKKKFFDGCFFCHHLVGLGGPVLDRGWPGGLQFDRIHLQAASIGFINLVCFKFVMATCCSTRKGMNDESYNWP